MTKEEWRNLHEGDVIENNGTLYYVHTTGWDDMDEEDYQDENDYIIDCNYLDEPLGSGGTILRAEYCRVRPELKSILSLLPEDADPYEFIKGMQFYKSLINI